MEELCLLAVEKSFPLHDVALRIHHECLYLMQSKSCRKNGHCTFQVHVAQDQRWWVHFANQAKLKEK